MKLSSRQISVINDFAKQTLLEIRNQGIIYEDYDQDEHIDVLGMVSTDPELEEKIDISIENFIDSIKESVMEAVAKATGQDLLDIKPVFEMTEDESNLSDEINHKIREYIVEMTANSLQYMNDL